MPKPSLEDLGPDFVEQATSATNPHLAIEALRATLTEEPGKVSRHNLVRQRAFPQRLTELMNKYTNQQLTSAEVIAELIEVARDVSHDAQRGSSSIRRSVRTSWPSSTPSPRTSRRWS